MQCYLCRSLLALIGRREGNLAPKCIRPQYMKWMRIPGTILHPLRYFPASDLTIAIDFLLEIVLTDIPWNICYECDNRTSLIPYRAQFVALCSNINCSLISNTRDNSRTGTREQHMQIQQLIRELRCYPAN